MVSPHSYLGIHLDGVHADQRQVVSGWDFDLLAARGVGEETLLADKAVADCVLTVRLLVERVCLCQSRGAADIVEHVGYGRNREAGDETGLHINFKDLGGSVLREGCLRVVVQHVDSAFDGDRVDTN